VHIERFELGHRERPNGIVNLRDDRQSSRMLVLSHRSAEVPSRSSRVIVEKPTESRAATDRTDSPHRGSTGDQLVVERLVIPLAMIVLEVLGHHETEVTVTHGDEAIQAFFLD
jgi:hypothetical protein